MKAEDKDGVLYIYPMYDVIEDEIGDMIDEIAKILKEEGIMIPVPPVDEDKIIGSLFYTYPFESNPNIPEEILINGSLKLSDSAKAEVQKGRPCCRKGWGCDQGHELHRHIHGHRRKGPQEDRGRIR